MDVYLEVGSKRIFAAALDWPGWSRSAKDEASALQMLLDYAPRYQRAIQPSGLALNAPASIAELNIIERLQGGSGTDYGVPGMQPRVDSLPVSEEDLEKFRAIFRALWQAFDSTLQAARGRALRTGPRGGGRSLEQIAAHVMEAEQGYLTMLGASLTAEQKSAPPELKAAILHEAILYALGASARGELPTSGPRGGRRWGARFFTRYAAWHLLDHTWEIEDRLG